eukprot:10537183-Lingulodinium_polyedra.AAC.1
MTAFVAAGLTIRVRGRQYAVEPLVAVGHVAREIPASGPTAAQLLHWAASRAGRSPGVNGTR